MTESNRFTCGGLSVVVQPEAVASMRALAAGAFPFETGGVLVGRYEGGDTAVVTSVLGPCPDAEHGLRGFWRGTEGLEQHLRALWDQGLYFLGEWHTHPAADPTPSDVDAATMRATAENPQAQCPEPILLIVGGVPGTASERWSATVYRRAGVSSRLNAA
ncbi:Mov34/MPN/PAD-1 family protein [Sorangium sp. So ce233]|uniref:Mov34/MPN/PAD-1 family protein n=1 Tax=Sorangium sp. So ce233 TaxID=3133290 RepID=UPI003F5E0606